MHLRWLPNALTLARMTGGLAVPVFLALGRADTATIVFILAAVTDALDGLAARHLGAASPLGAALDLWADKLLVAGTLIGFALIPGLFSVAALGLVCLTSRDLAVMALRAGRPGLSIPASRLAKAKTAIVMVALAALLAGLAWPLPALAASLALAALALGCALSLQTGWQYFAAARKPG